jgi:hypothetical protein
LRLRAVLERSEEDREDLSEQCVGYRLGIKSRFERQAVSEGDHDSGQELAGGAVEIQAASSRGCGDEVGDRGS